MLDILTKGEANLAGVGIVIEKSFQEGIKKLHEKGLKVKSLAKIKSLDGKIEFDK